MQPYFYCLQFVGPSTFILPALGLASSVPLHTIYAILHCLSRERDLPAYLWHDFQRLLYVIAATSMLLPAAVPADEQLLLPLRSWIQDQYPVNSPEITVDV